MILKQNTGIAEGIQITTLFEIKKIVHFCLIFSDNDVNFDKKKCYFNLTLFLIHNPLMFN